MRSFLSYLIICISIQIILSFPLNAQITNIAGNQFNPPLEIPLRLSGNFGELRSNHFHSGIDIKTQGTSGKKVYAIEEGYVFRIKVSENGYGKALYIHHPDRGVSSVYGHLDRFNDELEAYVKERQYKGKTFEIQLFPGNQKFRVKKGSLIGYSGNSGSSKGPHLHFEIRKMANQHPLNPLRYNFNITDNIPPKIFNLAIYPGNYTSLINGENEKVIMDVVSSGEKNHYTVQNNNPVNLHGSIGFGIRSYDFLNGTPNWCGVYSIKMYVDSTLMYRHTMDQFSFSETRYINSLIDYELKQRDNNTLQKTFLQPHNNLSIYDFVRNDGFYQFDSDTAHRIKYEVTDAYDNTSILSFEVRGTSGSKQRPEQRKKDYIQEMPYNIQNHFESEDIKLNFPKNAFYDTLYFTYSKQEMKGNKFYSDLHQVHNIYTPVHAGYTLSIKTKNLPEMLKEKAFIAHFEEDEYVFAGGKIVNGFISDRVNEFGEYVVMVDNEKPTINKFIVNDEKIGFKIKDELSGIKSYNGFIDGEWALFEYDPKNDLLTYKMDESRLSEKNVHELELYISDELNNIATHYETFTIE